jgi:hypothetical protein
MAELYRHPEQIRFGEDVYSMGRALERLNHTEPARRCYRLARKGAAGSKAASALAVSYRRGGEWDQAADVWREMIRLRQGGVRPYVELAKYEEHRRKDIHAALRLTERAMMLLSEPALREERTVQEAKNELQYRYDRLRRKTQNAAGMNPDGKAGTESRGGTE